MGGKSKMLRADYTDGQRQLISDYKHALRQHMAERKPKRYAHSLSVAKTAEDLALRYGVDPFEAHVAGILHDWHKVYDNDEQVEIARRLGIDLGVDAPLVANLLHGLLTARELPGRFPEVDDAVWQAIARHTTGAVDMSPLDMVLFVADGIEPLRRPSPGIERTRSLVGQVTLEDLYWESFVGGVIYVLQTQRYLYPGTLDIYNQCVLARAQDASHNASER